VGVPAALAFALSAAQTVTAEIQARLGHSNAATTSRYSQHIAPQQLISTIRQRMWRPD
jgi:integrase